MEAGKLKSPYPWFGGKSRVASVVWKRFGNVRNYCEPFFGSGAVLLQRPTPFDGTETINDKDCFVANFWRALQADPESVMHWCDWPVNEADLHARHTWLVNYTGEAKEKIRIDPEFYDARIAGWWVWGLCQWIGSGWCEHDEWKQLPHLGAGRGVHRPSQQRPHLGAGRGVHRPSQKRPNLGETGAGLMEYFYALSDRLRSVRVCCGDWSRILGDSPTVKLGVTAVFLDPPYSSESGRDVSLYAQEDLSVARAVREWCMNRGGDPRLRIALCGYEGEHESLESAGWSCLAWKPYGGYANQSKNENANATRERIWFSPHCIPEVDMPLFESHLGDDT